MRASPIIDGTLHNITWARHDNLHERVHAETRIARRQQNDWSGAHYSVVHFVPIADAVVHCEILVLRSRSSLTLL
jgi:hypothetical protein